MPVQHRTHPYYRIHCVLQRVSSWGLAEWVVLKLGWLIGVNLSLSATLLALLRYSDPRDQDLGAFAPVASWLHAHRFTVVSLLLAIQLCLSLLRWLLQRKMGSINVAKVEKVLNVLVTSIFEEQNRAEHVYRATLFLVKRSRCFGCWLGATARSGHTYRRLTTVFSIDPEARAHNTGYAGECWRQSGQTIMSHRPLPDQRRDNLSGDDRVQYKMEGWLADEEFNALAVKSRVFLATGIKVDGVIWGVLVLDSTDPEALPATRTGRGQETIDAERRRRTLEFAAESLSLLIR